MATLVYDERALEDFERLADFLAAEDPSAADATAALIQHALAVLTAHPLIGRPVAGDLRELVISRGSTGYLALYDYRPDIDRVIVHAIRHQREAGFDDDHRP